MSLLFTMYFTFSCPEHSQYKTSHYSSTPTEAFEELARYRLNPTEGEAKHECTLLSVKIGH